MIGISEWKIGINFSDSKKVPLVLSSPNQDAVTQEMWILKIRQDFKTFLWWLILLILIPSPLLLLPLGEKKRTRERIIQSPLIAYWNKTVSDKFFVVGNLFFYYKIRDTYYPWKIIMKYNWVKYNFVGFSQGIKLLILVESSKWLRVQ